MHLDLPVVIAELKLQAEKMRQLLFFARGGAGHDLDSEDQPDKETTLPAHGMSRYLIMNNPLMIARFQGLEQKA